MFLTYIHSPEAIRAARLATGDHRMFLTYIHRSNGTAPTAGAHMTPALRAALGR